MATPAYQEQMVNCRTAVMEPSASPLPIPRQRDGGFFDTEALGSFERPTRQVQGLGRISLVHSRTVQLQADASPRLRRTMAIELGDDQHYVRITEPESQSPTQPLDSIVMFHGFTEMIDTGTGRNLHDALAPHFSDKRIISIATDGVGRYCQKLSGKKALGRTFSDMAVARHRLINAVSGDGTVSLVGVSMGSVIGLNVLAFDSTLPAINTLNPDSVSDRKLPIAAVVNHSHAQVPFDRILPDMIIRFPRHIARDGYRKHRTLEKPADGIVAAMRGYPRSLNAMTGNLLNLLRGTDYRDVAAAGSRYRTGYISGALDPLCQPLQLTRLAHQNPDTVRIHIKPGFGHAACLDAVSEAREIAEMHNILTAL